MRPMIVTTPIRPYPTTFPPIGSLSILNYLRKNGIEDVEFYNIDGNRPEYSEVLKHISEYRPSVLGISAVVSTAYAYTKCLVQDVKAMLPDTLVVVGGGLAASAEILLRKAGVDICVLGEGERVFLNILRRSQTTRNKSDFMDIPGLMLLDAVGRLINTGYEEALKKEEIYDIDWKDLESSSDINFYIFDAYKSDGQVFPWFASDPRSYEPHRKDKKVGSLPGAKGCVARCTFCHRWDKGIRYIPPELIIERQEYLIEKYNVGFLSVADENFGTSQKWLKEFCERIKPYDILWQVAGMRVNCVSAESLKMMHDAGCASVAMGIETGSPRMLKIMEKKVNIEDNYNAIRWMYDYGIDLTPELILGMPGECTETVMETATLASFAKTLSPLRDPLKMSSNYAQALPGTPLYEFARRRGLIGSSLDEEEEYLLRISDQNAADLSESLNLTNSSDVVRQSWRILMQTRVAANYIRAFGREQYIEAMKKNPNFIPLIKYKKQVGDNMVVDRGIDLILDASLNNGEARLPRLIELIVSGKFSLVLLLYPVFFDNFPYIIYIRSLLRLLYKQGIVYVIKDIYEHTIGPKRRVFDSEYASLRKIVENEIEALSTDSPEMLPLRRGR